MTEFEGTWHEFDRSHPLARFIRDEQARSLVDEMAAALVGRDALITEIAEWVSQESSTYLRLSGEPGIGKTALAARLVGYFGAATHFFIRGQQASVEKLFKNLAAQLAVRYQLPLTEIPQGPDPDWMFGLLKACREASEQDIIVVIDALDECVDVEDLGTVLPHKLPSGVRVIETSRPSIPLNQRGLHTIDLDDSTRHSANHGAVREYVAQQLSQHAEKFARALAAWTERGTAVTLEQLATIIETRADQNFMYATIVLAAIRDRILGPEQLESIEHLPHRLVEYYEIHWRAMRQRDAARFNGILTGFVGLLAVVAESVSITKICEFTRESRSDVLDAIETWRQFLHVETVAREQRYRLYHVTFRDFLAGKLDLGKPRDRIIERLFEKMDQIACLVLTPMPLEHMPLGDMLGLPVEAGVSEDCNYAYRRWGEVPCNELRLPLVAILPRDIGPFDAHDAMESALGRWQPYVCALVGIAGGLQNTALGDVHIALNVWSWDSRRLETAAGTKFAPVAQPISRWGALHGNLLRSDGAAFSKWQERRMKRARELNLPVTKPPDLVITDVATGDAVVDLEALRSDLIRLNRKLTVVEMEASGVARAVAKRRGAEFPLYIIRGVSDLAANKGATDAVLDGGWRTYAAENAASLLLLLLESYGIPGGERVRS